MHVFAKNPEFVKHHCRGVRGGRQNGFFHKGRHIRSSSKYCRTSENTVPAKLGPSAAYFLKNFFRDGQMEATKRSSGKNDAEIELSVTNWV